MTTKAVQLPEGFRWALDHEIVRLGSGTAFSNIWNQDDHWASIEMQFWSKLSASYLGRTIGSMREAFPSVRFAKEV